MLNALLVKKSLLLAPIWCIVSILENFNCFIVIDAKIYDVTNEGIMLAVSRIGNTFEMQYVKGCKSGDFIKIVCRRKALTKIAVD